MTRSSDTSPAAFDLRRRYHSFSFGVTTIETSATVRGLSGLIPGHYALREIGITNSGC